MAGAPSRDSPRPNPSLPAPNLFRYFRSQSNRSSFRTPFPCNRFLRKQRGGEEAAAAAAAAGLQEEELELLPTSPPGQRHHRQATEGNNRGGGGEEAMGSFEGHALPGTLFLVVGLWHVWSALSRHAADPKSFRVRAWNPGSGGLARLELYLIVGGSFLDLCIELLYSTHLRVFVDGGVLNPAHTNDFEHAGMLLMFFLFGGAALLSQTTRFLPLPEGVLCLLGATAFSTEYLLFYFHSTTHKGLEGYYHLLLVLLIGLCVASAVAGALLPTSFPADLCNGIAVTLQGLWFYQTALVLYGPMMPEGCQLEDNQIACRSAGIEVRGELLASFQFFALVLLVLTVVVGLYGFAASKYGNPDELSKLHAEELRTGSEDVE